MDTCTHGWMDEWKNEWMSTCEGCTGYQFQPKGDNAEWYGAAAKSLQSCPPLWDPIDSSPPGSPVPEIHQARTLEWVAISFSNGWKWKVKVKSLSRVQLSDPMDCSLPGSSVHGIFQARVLEWDAIAFSKTKRYQHYISLELGTWETSAWTLLLSKQTKKSLVVMRDYNCKQQSWAILGSFFIILV